MAAAGGQASRTTVWVFRSLALGTTVSAGLYVAPIAKAALWQNAHVLLDSHSPSSVTAGAKRLASAARANPADAMVMAERGDLVKLAKCARRPELQAPESASQLETLLTAMIAIASAPGVPDTALRHREVAATLADLDECGESCLLLWKLAGVPRPETRDQRIEHMLVYINGGSS